MARAPRAGDARGSQPPGGEVVLDCDAGIRLGCEGFCCRLLVRLAPGEPDPGLPDTAGKSCVDKDPDTGLCVYYDTSSRSCTVWERRPAVCRAYDCNRDPLLQVVLRDGLRSLTDLVRAEPPPRRRWTEIPYREAPERAGEAAERSAAAGPAGPTRPRSPRERRR